jgi:hypothetical protein
MVLPSIDTYYRKVKALATWNFGHKNFHRFHHLKDTDIEVRSDEKNRYINYLYFS